MDMNRFFGWKWRVEISHEKGTTVLFPVPIDLLGALRGALDKPRDGGGGDKS